MKKNYTNVILALFLLIGISIAGYGFIKMYQGQLAILSYEEVKSNDYNKTIKETAKNFGDEWETMSIKEKVDIVGRIREAREEGYKLVKTYKGIKMIIVGFGLALSAILLKVFFIS
jgi:hypothetical protein